MSKACYQCKLEKSLDEFHNCRTRPDGKQPYCKACTKDNAKKFYQANKEKVDEKNRQWKAANRKPGTPEQNRRNHLKTKYRITPEQFGEMLAAQGGRCAICGTDEPDGQWNVDHDHLCCPGSRSCGDCVRQILCPPCNRAIGQFDDDPERMIAAAEYVIRHRVGELH